MMSDLDAYRFLVENMTDGVYFVDRDRRITGWNHGATVISGFPADAVVGRRCRDEILNHVDGSGRLLCASGCPLEAVMADGLPRQAYVWMRRMNGSRMPVRVRATAVRDDDGVIVGAMEVFADDTPTVHALARDRELQRTETTDPLTGLGNASYLDVELESLRRKWERQGWPFGVLVVQVDNLASLVAQHGANAGDRALRLVADTLVQTLPGTAVVTRDSEGWFVALVLCADTTELATTANQVETMLAASQVVIDERRLPVRVSVGHTMITQGDDVETLMCRAERALRHGGAECQNPVEPAS